MMTLQISLLRYLMIQLTKASASVQETEEIIEIEPVKAEVTTSKTDGEAAHENAQKTPTTSVTVTAKQPEI